VNILPRLTELTLSANKIKKLSVSELFALENLNVAQNPITKLTLNSKSFLGSLDVRSTKIKVLDLRQMNVYVVKARGTKIKIMTPDPLSSRLAWQQFIDTGVKITSK
jgi:hypothetical protein